MHVDIVELEAYSLAWLVIYIPTLCMQAAKALKTRLDICWSPIG